MLSYSQKVLDSALEPLDVKSLSFGSTLKDVSSNDGNVGMPGMPASNEDVAASIKDIGLPIIQQNNANDDALKSIQKDWDELVMKS